MNFIDLTNTAQVGSALLIIAFLLLYIAFGKKSRSAKHN